jgi:hypothetical protein
VNDITPFPCSGCERPHEPARPVTWSPAWSEWLCPNCRASRTNLELGATSRANAAAALRADQ